MTDQSNLFEETASRRTEAAADLHDRIDLAAHRLAVQFTEDVQLPARYRRLADSDKRKRQLTQDSEVEKRFWANVQGWRSLIEAMLTKLRPEQAWRFISLAPQIAGNLAQVTDNSDFCDFMDYLVLRRDEEKCDAEELGGLARLSTAFQREVEKRVQRDRGAAKTEPDN